MVNSDRTVNPCNQRTGNRRTGNRAIPTPARMASNRHSPTARPPRDAARHADRAAPAAPPPAAPAGTDPNVAALVRGALYPRAATEAKGMKEDGEAVGGILQEGGVLTQEFTLQPGRCYTVLGQGLPPITELDLQVAPKPLIAGAPVLIPPVTDQTTGAAASISPGKNCYVNPTFLPVAVILTVKATKGSGPAGAQVYSRPK